MEEVASTPKLVDPAALDAEAEGLTATLPRFEIESALQDDAGADLFLEIASIQNGERDDRTVKVAWERADLEALLERASGDAVTLTFDAAEIERMFETPDVEAQGLREKVLVLTIAAATAAGAAGSAGAYVALDGGGGPAPISGLVTDNNPLGQPAAAAAPEGISGLITDASTSGQSGTVSGFITDASTSGTPDAVRGGFITDTGSEATRNPATPVADTGGGFSMPSAAVDAALAGGIALLITGAAFVGRTTRRQEQPA